MFGLGKSALKRWREAASLVLVRGQIGNVSVLYDRRGGRRSVFWQLGEPAPPQVTKVMVGCEALKGSVTSEGHDSRFRVPHARNVHHST
jgi:hypothetical protein